MFIIGNNQDCALLNMEFWTPPPLEEDMLFGDMPGDKVEINDVHIEKAACIFKHLQNPVKAVLDSSGNKKVVISVWGGSGVGKSETASLLTHYFKQLGIGSYTLSGDNYPHRIPEQNDAERLRVFRSSGVRGLVSRGCYTSEIAGTIRRLQDEDRDLDPAAVEQYPWLSVYRQEGRKGLKGYLGTENEIDFRQLCEIISQFKNGVDKIWLKRMGRKPSELWYEQVDFSKTSILVIEWTHGNNDSLHGVDIPVLLNSTPEETREHRRQRGRDGKTDSPFTTMVLEIEQELLESQAGGARLIMSKDGDVISYGEYRSLMAGRGGAE